MGYQYEKKSYIYTENREHHFTQANGVILPLPTYQLLSLFFCSRSMAIDIYNKGRPPFPIKGNGFLAVFPPPLPASSSSSSSSSSSTVPRSSAVITSVTGCSVLANTSAGAIPGSHTLSTCDASTARSTPPTIGTVTPESPPPPPVTNASRAPTSSATTTPPVTSTNACTTRSRRLSLPTSAKLIPSRCSNAIVFGSNVYPKPSGTAAKIPSNIIGRINVRNPRNPGRSNPREIRTSAFDSSARALE
mmetsp:Transcript_13869/g.14036  ORF Transcript_13869/g.14036 Transcript_13869/m.14036 type:complete len:247 (-) Transcript_13869:119-859(-)